MKTESAVQKLQNTVLNVGIDASKIETDESMLRHPVSKLRNVEFDLQNDRLKPQNNRLKLGIVGLFGVAGSVGLHRR